MRRAFTEPFAHFYNYFFKGSFYFRYTYRISLIPVFRLMLDFDAQGRMDLWIETDRTIRFEAQGDEPEDSRFRRRFAFEGTRSYPKRGCIPANDLRSLNDLRHAARPPERDARFCL